MKRTLIICARFPHPESDGSSMRTMNFARYFSRQGEVDILYRKGGPDPAAGCSLFRAGFHVLPLPAQASAPSFLARLSNKLFGLKAWALDHCTAEIEQQVRQIVIRGHYDHILCRYHSEAYPLLGLAPDLRQRVILDVDDIVTDSIYDAETRDLHGLHRVARMLDRLALSRYHGKCTTFGTILFCSDADRSRGAKLLRGKSHVVPNTFPQLSLPYAYENDGHRHINRLLFVGSLRYTPNCQGLCWFAGEILPKLLESFSDVKLTVVGRNPPDELLSLAKAQPAIELHADVPDIAPFYASSGVSIVPLLAGGGTRIKILESGFVRRPVLSTALGAYGLGMVDGREIMLFHDSRSFLERYRLLREDAALYAAVAENSFLFVRSNFSFDNFRQAMDAALGRPA
jgi:glycosyltransferase involved in cell wall biosynthesis